MSCTLLTHLTNYKPFTALLIGDFMLDQHVYGAAERLSPDAPVPILQATRSENRPGGAANVALCMNALKGNVECFGVVGDDSEGRIIRDELQRAGCTVNGILTDATRPTTVKRSLIGLAQHRHPQKMFRLDFESKQPIDDDLCEQLIALLDARIAAADIVCIEDYNKGVCSPALCQRVIERCRAAGKPVLVDPAVIESFERYRGATAITPNRSEAELATGLDTPIDASQVHNAGLARKLLVDLDLDAVVLTLDKHGALLETRDGDPQLVPTVARSVYDVTGAGDVVLAALAGALANGLPWLDSVQFANAAAGLEVEVFGVQPIAFVAVQREVLAQQRGLSGKVRTLDELLVEVAVQRDGGRRVVLTNGCFDVIHAGHVAYLREAKQLGDVLIVAINDDAGVHSLKGEGRPVYGEAERLEILSELQCIDYLTVFSDATVSRLLEALRPDLYVKGGDYQAEDIAEYDLIRELGLELRVLSHRPGLASTSVIERLAQTDQ